MMDESEAWGFQENKYWSAFNRLIDDLQSGRRELTADDVAELQAKFPGNETGLLRAAEERLAIEELHLRPFLGEVVIQKVTAGVRAILHKAGFTDAPVPPPAKRPEDASVYYMKAVVRMLKADLANREAEGE